MRLHMREQVRHVNEVNTAQCHKVALIKSHNRIPAPTKLLREFVGKDGCASCHDFNYNNIMSCAVGLALTVAGIAPCQWHALILMSVPKGEVGKNLVRKVEGLVAAATKPRYEAATTVRR